jgi:hypothetical protein
MPRGLKETSSTISIGFGVAESAANTFTQGEVDLNLDPLNLEVFVVQSMNLDATPPDGVPGTDTQTVVSLTTTRQTAIQTLNNANCLATARLDIVSGAPGDSVSFTRSSTETPSTELEYLGIIATSDFFIQVQGANNTAAKNVTGKMYGYRARADAAIYAALVQSEVLSA